MQCPWHIYAMDRQGDKNMYRHALRNIILDRQRQTQTKADEDKLIQI